MGLFAGSKMAAMLVIMVGFLIWPKGLHIQERSFMKRLGLLAFGVAIFSCSTFKYATGYVQF